MTGPVFGSTLVCRHCLGSGVLARNGRPAGQELVDELRAEGRHPRTLPAHELAATLKGRVVRRCGECAGEGIVPR